METYLIRITDYLVAQSWQIAILVVVIAAASLALKNRSAHIRYLLWLIVLAKCLVPPLLTVPLAVLPQEESAEPVPISPPTEMSAVDLEVADTTVAEPPEAPSAPVETAPMARERPTEISIREWLGAGWIVGTGVFLIFNLLRALRANIWLWKRRKLLPAELRSDIENLFSAHGIKSFPSIWLVDGMNQPFVWGVLRGSIYLPVDFLNINKSEHQRSVLGHELSHIVRLDAAVNFLQVVAQAIFWFHPFVWWANRRIRAEREKCCDEMAIARLNASPRDYSQAIIEALAAKCEPTRPVPSLAVAGPVKNIEERIRTMLRPGKKFYKHPSLPVVAVVVLIAVPAVPTAVVLTARADTAPAFSNPTNLGSSINSSAHEYDPSISADELELYFNSFRPGGPGQSDIWVATRKTKADPWGSPVNLGLTVNSSAREHAPSISADGLSLYFSSDRPGGYGVQDLWVTTRETKSAPWGVPVNLGPTVNSAAREHAPSISTDGLELYFSGLWELPQSLRPGGSGGSDIWVTRRKTERDPWGPPVNLGPTVNSPAYDESPSISYDGVSLYFQSNRSGGSGKNDIWVTKRKSTSDPWGTPVNLGPTANSVNMDGNPDISKDGSTLYFASRRPDDSRASDLWQVSLKPRTRRDKPTKSLAAAVLDGDMHQVGLHLSTGTAVDAKDSKGRTALYRAASEGHTEIAKLLVARGADINAMDESEQTALHRAALNGKTEMADLLILKGADVNAEDKYGRTPISRALLSEGGGRRMVELLVNRRAKVSALHLAAHRGDLDGVRDSLKKGINVDARDEAGQTPLYYAVSAGHMHITEFLISRGAEVDAKDKVGDTPLYYAADAGWRNTTELLLNKGADVNARNQGRETPLHSAAWFGRADVAKLLIDKGADIMAKDQWDYIPLHAAACSGLVEVTELLIARGSDIDAKDKWDGTPLTNAADCGLGESGYSTVKLLIDKGTDVNAKCIYGCTPLHHAVGRVSGCQPQPDVVRLLIANGANVNARRNNGQTPLHWAVLGGLRDIAELLVTSGADINAKDKQDRTPLDIVIEQGYTEIVELLRKHGTEE